MFGLGVGCPGAGPRVNMYWEGALSSSTSSALLHEAFLRPIHWCCFCFSRRSFYTYTIDRDLDCHLKSYCFLRSPSNKKELLRQHAQPPPNYTNNPWRSFVNQLSKELTTIFIQTPPSDRTVVSLYTISPSPNPSQPLPTLETTSPQIHLLYLLYLLYALNSHHAFHGPH